MIKIRGLGAVVLALATAACGGDSGGTSSPGTVAPPVAPVPTPTPTPTPTPAPAPAPTPTPTAGFNDAEYKASNAATSINALVAYNAGATGKNVTVGVVDSGLGNAATSLFAGRLSTQSADVVGTGGRGLDSGDGHGTSVAAIIAAARDGQGAQGIAFNSTLVVLRADNNGIATAGAEFSDNNIAKGLDAARLAGAKVVNLSLGGNNPPGTAMQDAFDRATAVGIIVVIAAGNDSAKTADAFASFSEDPRARGLIIVAGAANADGTFADFSNKAGSSAAHFVTALGTNIASYDNNGAQTQFSGTSAAAPVVTGAIALLEQAFPNLTPAQVVGLIYSTATKQPGGVDATYGQGSLDLTSAFAPLGTTSIAGIATPLAGTIAVDPLLAPGAAVTKALAGTVVLDTLGRAYVAHPTETARPRSPSAIGGLAANTGYAGNARAAIAWNRLDFTSSTRADGSNAGFNAEHAFIGTAGVGPWSSGAVETSGFRFAQSVGGVGIDFGDRALASGIVSSPTEASSPSGLVSTTSLADANGRGSTRAIRVASAGFVVAVASSALGSTFAADRAFRIGSVSSITGGLRYSVRHALSDTPDQRATTLALGIDGDRSAGLHAAAVLALGTGWSLALEGEADMVRPVVTGTGLAIAASPFARTSWAASLFRNYRGLRFGATVSQVPVNVGGAFTLLVPTSYDYATTSARFSPASVDASTRRQLGGELSMAGMVGNADVRAAAFTRPTADGSGRQENGVALRVSTAF